MRAAQRSLSLYARVEALDHLERALELGHPATEAHLAIADVLIALGRYRDALTARAGSRRRRVSDSGRSGGRPDPSCSPRDPAPSGLPLRTERVDVLLAAVGEAPARRGPPTRAPRGHAVASPAVVFELPEEMRALQSTVRKLARDKVKPVPPGSAGPPSTRPGRTSQVQLDLIGRGVVDGDLWRD